MAKGADYSFELIFNETCAPQFNGLNKFFLFSVYSRECNGMELFLNSHLFNINALKFICDYRKLSTLMFGVEGGMDAYCSFTHIHYN